MSFAHHLQHCCHGAGDKEQPRVNMVQTVENVYFHEYLYDYAGGSSSSSRDNTAWFDDSKEL